MSSLSLDHYLQSTGASDELLAGRPGALSSYQRSATHYGFERVRRLRGNIGYLALRAFHPVEQAGRTAVAAMHLISGTRALIVDLRQNHGGDRAMVGFLASFLFDTEAASGSETYWRPDAQEPSAATAALPLRPRYTDKDVYLLTSAETAGSAELFTGNLQALGRATVLGEVTRNGLRPDVAIAAEAALEMAHVAAIRQLASRGVAPAA